jgi:small basic protein
MWLPVIALIVGFLAVYLPTLFFPKSGGRIPIEYAPYIGIALVAGLDSLVGAIRSVVEGTFNDRVFTSGFFTNAAMAAAILYLGNRLGINNVDTAIMVALVIRMFNNLGFIRRYAFARLFEKRISSVNTFPEP